MWAVLIGWVLTLAIAGTAQAQQPTLDEINNVAKKLSCPTCTGINVADCPTETCAQWRVKVGELLAAGKTEQEILDYFAARYGDHVLQVPPARGWFLGVWIVPLAAIAVGLVVLARLGRGWSRRAAARSHVSMTAEPLEDEYLKRVERDVDAWKQ